MTMLTILKLIAQAAIVLLGAYAIYREKELMKFERKVARYIKAFFKALYYTAFRKSPAKSNISKLPTYRNEEYEQMLARLNKASKVDNVMIA